jgi:hypothetical protein
MNKKTVLAIVGFLAFNFCFGQSQQKYSELVNEASNYFESKEYLKSGQKYSEAFASLGDRGAVHDRYNAACAWALANKVDSAFVQLYRIAKKGNYTNYNQLTTDLSLNRLHSDKRWKQVVEIVKLNKEKAEANLDKALVAILDTVYQEDQKYRQQIEGIADNYGWESEEMKAHWTIINKIDSINLIKVKKILDEHGWLGSDIIGSKGSEALFLVIQHSDLATQEKYLPLMRDAVKKGKANSSALALLEDRVALRQGKKQIYGSQVEQDTQTGKYYILPLEDPDNVDKRRSEMGLGKLQDYVSIWNITWDVEEYKKKLPEIEAKQKK